MNITSAEGVKTKAKYEQASEIDGVSKIKFAKTLPAGQYQLVLDFNAAYDQQLDGIYKIEFEGKPYVMTQMEAISARQSFPSFDEPRFKTPFNIRLTIPSKYSGFANTQQTSEQIEKSGWKTLSFAQTKPLPTYLLALAVGPWQLQKGLILEQLHGVSSRSSYVVLHLILKLKKCSKPYLKRQPF